MKTKKWIILALAISICAVAAAPQAWAGSPQSYRWEGVAIGVGAAILGHALFQHHRQYSSPPPRPVRVYESYPPPRPAGHWQVEKRWVPARHKKVWNPGHYNRRGRWVPGHWMRLESSPGYWEKERVWVPHY